jgi:hypothetical protein
MSEKEFLYVRHKDVPEMLEKGWKVTNNNADCHHGEYSVIMEAPEVPSDPEAERRCSGPMF